MIGDVDPEDRWDAGDPAVELVDVLASWVEALEADDRADPTRWLARAVSAIASCDELDSTRALDPTTRLEVLGLRDRLGDLIGVGP